MAEPIQEIKACIKEYVLQHFSKNKNVNEITDVTPLIGSGLLDSISTMQLVAFLEKKFHFEFEAHEVDKDNFENISVLAEFVSKKL